MRPTAQKAVIAFFLVMIVAPPLSILLPVRAAEIENRRLLAPDFSFDNILSPDPYQQALTYVMAANPVRTWLIYIGTGVDYYLFGESPNPNAVLLGTNGWLYSRESIDSLCSPIAVTDAVRSLEEFVEELRGRGTVVIFTIAPAKFGVHPENLTEVQEQLVQCAGESIEVLRKAVTEERSPGYVDGRALFETMKGEGSIPYFRTDTHFNHAASVRLIEAMVEEIAPGIWDEGAVRSLGPSSFVGNLMTLVGLRETEQFEEVIVDRGLPRTPAEQLHDRFSDTQTATERFVVRGTAPEPLIEGESLVLKDSFMDIPAPSLAQYFRDLTFTDWRSEESVAYFLERAPSADIVIVETSEEAFLGRFGDEGMLTSP